MEDLAANCHKYALIQARNQPNWFSTNWVRGWLESQEFEHKDEVVQQCWERAIDYCMSRQVFNPVYIQKTFQGYLERYEPPKVSAAQTGLQGLLEAWSSGGSITCLYTNKSYKGSEIELDCMLSTPGKTSGDGFRVVETGQTYPFNTWRVS